MSIDPLTREQFIDHIIQNRPPSDWRMGQWLFNELYTYRPDIADKIRGTAADPFHNDENIGPFWNTVVREW